MIDTNVLISGLLWRGTPHTLLDRVRAGTLTLVISPVLLAELRGVIRRPKFRKALSRSGSSASQLADEVGRLATVLDPPALSHPASRDPNDDAVLALAVAAGVDVIVSGDADLLILDVYADIPIVTPAALADRLAGV